MQRVIHDTVHLTRKVMVYILDICTATRPPETRDGRQKPGTIYDYIRLGASPRATEFLLLLSKAYAFCHGRDFVKSLENAESKKICAGPPRSSASST